MNENQILEALLGTKESFESTLGRISGGDARKLLIRLLERLDGDEFLENAERERRFASVFTRVAPSTSDMALLAEAGARLKNGVLRNAIAQLLPPQYGGLVFNAQRRTRADSTKEPISRGRESQPEPKTALRNPSLAFKEHIPFSDVIVLSLADDPATKKLLEAAGFVPLRCSSLGELNGMLTVNTQEEICAFLVEGSFLKSLKWEDQEHLIKSLAQFSTFVWLRFQEEGLACENPLVEKIISRERCEPPDATKLSIQESAGLRERELPWIAAARKRLTEGKAQGLFIPGELSSLELKLLGAAMSQYSKKRHFDPRTELTRVQTEFLQGGQTGARVALVKVDDLRVPVIVKLHQKDLILDEARRFLTFIYRDNRELNPEVHFHSTAALIVFGIVPDSDAEAEKPAPTLEQLLSNYWYGEMKDPANLDDGSLLLRGFRDAARRIAGLNKRKCFPTRFPCKANPYLKNLKDMESKGFNWGLSGQAISQREWAESVLATAAEAAICHGDAHTRNLLIRTDQGFVIDYAYSGPGHPCSDLVRLELSLYLTKFFPFGSETEMGIFQRDFSIERLTSDDLISRHANLLLSKTNQLCLKMCVSARDLVAEVLRAHDLNWDHYLALKILTAWQSLQSPNLQHSLARGVITAIGS